MSARLLHASGQRSYRFLHDTICCTFQTDAFVLLVAFGCFNVYIIFCTTVGRSVGFTQSIYEMTSLFMHDMYDVLDLIRIVTDGLVSLVFYPYVTTGIQ